ncbi:MAG: hypothetical protein ACTHK8_13260 [Ginsengibacter sp.]
MNHAERIVVNMTHVCTSPFKIGNDYKLSTDSISFLNTGNRQ